MRLRVVFAIALLAIRAALCSRLVATLAIVLALTTVGLPATLQGDGTLAGEVRIVLVYCLGLSALLLGVVNLWASCAAISQEVYGKQIRLIVVKPVPRLAIWLGRWIGLLILNAAFLAFIVVTILAVLYWKIHPSRTTEAERLAVVEEILVGRQRVGQLTDGCAKEVQRRFDLLRTAGRLPSDVPADAVLAAIQRRVEAERAIVPLGQIGEWCFPMPRRVPRNAPVILQIRLISSPFQRNRLTGVWTVGTPSNPEKFRWEVRNQLVPVQRIRLPDEVVRSVVLAAEPKERVLVVKYANHADEKTGAAIFDPTRGVEVLISRSRFLPNLLRAVLIIFCELALVAALGMTAGSVFSFPVATFAALSVIVSASVSHYLAAGGVESSSHVHHQGDVPARPTAVQKMAEKLVKATHAIVEPVMRFDPLDRLAEGLLVSWKMTAEAVLLLLLAFPACLAALGGWILRRRELALPT